MVPQKDAVGVAKELALVEYMDILEELRHEPPWRARADREDDYIDGNQLDTETLRRMRELGMAPVYENMMQPTINSVVGFEVKNRLDWRVTPERDERDSDMAEAVNVRLNEAEKRSRADAACSAAYEGVARVGFACVYAGRSHDPFAYPIECDIVPRNEVRFDWRFKKRDQSDMRYLLRQSWYDADQIAMAFHDKAELVDKVSRCWTGIDAMFFEGGNNTELKQGFADESRWTTQEQEWRDSYRRRLLLTECWYRRWVWVEIFTTRSGRVVEFDPENPMHVQAKAVGAIQPRRAMVSKVRLSWWVGPHKLADIPNPYKHGKIPYILFFGYREALTGVPFGLGRPMMPIQDEINARKTKMIWLLSAKRITMTEGATVDDEETVRQEAARPDAVHVLDAEKMRNGGIFKVESDFQLNSQQYQTLVDNRAAIKDVAGVHSTFEGRDTGVTAGNALATLVDQSVQSLARLNDGFQYSRQLLGDLFCSYVIEDIGREEAEIVVPSELGEPKRIKINTPAVDEATNTQYLDNDIQRAQLRVSLSDVPSTHSYRAQEAQMLSSMIQALPPDLQPMMLDIFFARSDYPERKEIVKRLRKQFGYGDREAPKTPEEAAQQQAEDQQKQAASQLQLRDAVATVAEKEAKAAKTGAEAQKVASEVNVVDEVRALSQQVGALANAMNQLMQQQQPSPTNWR